MASSILIVDDEPPMQARLRRILSTVGFSQDVMCIAGNIAEGKAQAEGVELAMALVDLGLPDGNGVELVGWLRARFDTLPILVISAWSVEEMIFAALRAGASGYVLKERDDTEIAASLTNVLKGGAPIDPFIARHILDFIAASPNSTAPVHGHDRGDSEDALSARELDILGCVAKGMTNREIANSLEISRWTVDTYVRRIYRKLAVSTRIQAVEAARSHGFLR
jgi:DNA-binding NarL/FixJ family response regulator